MSSGVIGMGFPQCRLLYSSTDLRRGVISVSDVQMNFSCIDPENWDQYAEPAKKDKTKDPKHHLKAVEVSDNRPYWAAARAVVDTWAKYQSAKWVLFNATHEETKHAVAAVIDRYYDGSMQALITTEAQRSAEVDSMVKWFETICKNRHVEPISRDWLYHHLECDKDYASYRGKIDRRAEKNKPPVSLKELGGRRPRRKKA